MLHHSFTIRPMGSEQRIGKTRMTCSTSGSRSLTDDFSRKKLDWRKEQACSCAATFGSDVLDDSSQSCSRGVDVRNIRTALNIVYSYDSSKDLKLPRLTERRPSFILKTQPLDSSSMINHYKEQIKSLAEQSDRMIKKTTEEKNNSSPREDSTKKEKVKDTKSVKKRAIQPKTILKKTVFNDELQAGDTCFCQRKKSPGSSSTNCQQQRQERGDMHRVSFKLTPSLLGEQSSEGKILKPVPYVSSLLPIDENDKEERDFVPKDASSFGRQCAAAKRPQPTTQRVHDWLAVSSYKVLATKEPLTPQEESTADTAPPKMQECDSGVIGMIEVANKKLKKRKVFGRQTHLIRHESKIKITHPLKEKSSFFTKEKSDMHCNSFASMSSYMKISSQRDTETNTLAIIKSMTPDDNKTELTLPARKNDGSKSLLVVPTSKFRRNPGLTKPSEKQIQKGNSSKVSNKGSNTTLRRRSGIPHQKLSSTKVKHGSKKTKKKTGKSFSKEKNQDTSKGRFKFNKSAGDLLNTWIMQLTYG